MKNLTSLIFGILATFFSFVAHGQSVGIGNTNPNTNALLEIGELPGDQGLLLPRLKNGTITSLSGTYGATEQGMMVYDIDNDVLLTWNGTAWVPVNGGDNDWTPVSQSIVNTTNRIGIGNNAPRARVHINAASNDTALIVDNGSGSTGLFASAGASGANAGVFYKGNVLIYENLGIGTTGAPGADLHVVGSFIYEDGNENNGHVLRSNAAGLATWVPHDVSFNVRVESTYLLPQVATPANTIFDLIYFNNGPGTISPNGQYTVKASGIYFISSTILLKASGGSETLRMEILVDGNPVATSYQQCDLTNECTCTVTTTLDLAEDEVVSIALYPLTGDRDIQGSSTHNYSNFFGHLIQAK